MILPHTDGLGRGVPGAPRCASELEGLDEELPPRGAGAVIVGERLREAVATQAFAGRGGRRYAHLTVSVGVAALDQGEPEAAELVEQRRQGALRGQACGQEPDRGVRGDRRSGAWLSVTRAAQARSTGARARDGRRRVVEPRARRRAVDDRPPPDRAASTSGSATSTSTGRSRAGWSRRRLWSREITRRGPRLDRHGGGHRRAARVSRSSSSPAACASSTSTTPSLDPAHLRGDAAVGRADQPVGAAHLQRRGRSACSRLSRSATRRASPPEEHRLLRPARRAGCRRDPQRAHVPPGGAAEPAAARAGRRQPRHLVDARPGRAPADDRAGGRRSAGHRRVRHRRVRRRERDDQIVAFYQRIPRTTTTGTGSAVPTRLQDFPSDRATLYGGRINEESVSDPTLDEANRRSMIENGEKTILSVPLDGRRPADRPARLRRDRSRAALHAGRARDRRARWASRRRSRCATPRSCERLEEQNRRLDSLLAVDESDHLERRPRGGAEHGRAHGRRGARLPAVPDPGVRRRRQHRHRGGDVHARPRPHRATSRCTRRSRWTTSPRSGRSSTARSRSSSIASDPDVNARSPWTPSRSSATRPT